jgi:hypothetical protein
MDWERWPKDSWGDGTLACERVLLSLVNETEELEEFVC